ncbi:MAG: adenylyl-sulfate reductase [Gammaproteobacteria bacterium]|nr:adenylyl-sulfate reductase [Gammaproteobacteria bacterium]
MFTTNPFAPLTAFVSPDLMQGYIVLMVLAVAIGTAFDLLRDKKLTFFLQERQRTKAAARQPLGGADMAAIAARTLAHDIATFGEFCNRQRRISHALMFYGFVTYLVTTVVMVFAYPTATHPPVVLPVLWNLGALMALVGGYWFFFFLRVNVVHDGHPPWRLVRADLFIVTLLASLTFALVFEWVTMAGNPVATRVFAGLYLFFTTLLFVSVPWSKFAHMFYKPVVAFQKRQEAADGSSDLPAPTTAGGERCPPSHT